MKTIMANLILFFSMLALFEANAAVYDKNTLVNVKLEYVSFYEAVVDIEFYLADDLDHAFFYVQADDVTRGMYASYVQHGFNKIKAVIQRERNKNRSITTRKIRLYATANGAKRFWQQSMDFEINWPGPEYINEVIGDSKVEHYDYSSVNTVNIVRHAYEARKIYRDVLVSGVPIYKARISGIFVVPSSDTGLAVKIGVDVDPAAARKIISGLLKNNHNIVDITVGDIDRKIYFDNDIIIAPAKKETLTAETLAILKNNTLSNEDFYALLGVKKPEPDDYVERQYKIAYDLIDSGLKPNLSRAKTILDEIISRDPDFVDAYIELARYIMKTAEAPVSFDMAEKKLLIARDINPEHANTRVLLGYVYTNQGRYDEAEKEYQKAEKLGTDNLWLYANRGLNFEKQSKTDQAIEQYIKVMSSPRKFDRNDRVMLWTHVRLFPLLESRQRYKEANRYYTKFVHDFPSQSCVLLSQAENELFNLGDYESAIEHSLLAGKEGCSRESAALAPAYYLKWFNQTENGERKINGVYRQAEAMAPEDVRLFYYLALSDFTSPVIHALVQKGRNLDVENGEGFTPLLLSVYTANRQAVKRLLAEGANINNVSRKMKISPLGLAVIRRDIDMVKLLIENGADTEMALPNGKDLYSWSRENGAVEISRLLGNKKSI
ncbi:MAG TPA: tetratricopeptide repeat protein [Gammaproteobacteria bacterium]|nr:tetratricopeptide repeat protein [Gammaproteobacteria bacterium]